MPVKPLHSTPSTTHRRRRHGDRPCGPRSEIGGIYHLEMHEKSRHPKVDGSFFASLPASVASPLRQLKRIEHDVIASKSACRVDYLYHCVSVVTKHLYQVFTMTSSIWYMNAQGSHGRSTSINVIFLMSCWQVLWLYLGLSSIGGWLRFTRLVHLVCSGFSWTDTSPTLVLINS